MTAGRNCCQSRVMFRNVSVRLQSLILPPDSDEAWHCMHWHFSIGTCAMCDHALSYIYGDEEWYAYVACNRNMTNMNILLSNSWQTTLETFFAAPRTASKHCVREATPAAAPTKSQSTLEQLSRFYRYDSHIYIYILSIDTDTTVRRPSMWLQSFVIILAINLRRL